MNENINLCEILKDCPVGTKFYSTICGDVTFCYIDESDVYPIKFTEEGGGDEVSVSAKGKYYVNYDGECTLFPSKDQRDWSKFSAPWYKKDKFDPNTLKPFDKILARCDKNYKWVCELFSHIDNDCNIYQFKCCGSLYNYCIPYNNDTKHLVGTTEEAPEYYRYWED